MTMSALALGLFLSMSAQAGVSIISDLDDTIKITNAADIFRAGVNGFFSTNIYTGMDDFFIESTLEGEDDQTFVVTSSPLFLKKQVSGLLRKHKIHTDSVTLRNVAKEKSHVFKKRVIREILSKSDDDFILIGDDVNEDHLIYDEIAKEYPERIKSSYIHVVKGRTLPASVIPYWSSFDLTLRENLAGRLPFSAVTRVARKILSHQKLKEIMPSFAFCPTDLSLWDWQKETAAAPEAAQISDKIVTYCLSRSGKN
jgi:hypothetical protein